MPRRDCPQCQRPLPYAARRCAPCGWAPGAAVDPQIRRAITLRRALVWLLVLGLLGFGGGVVSMKADAVADWYAGFAAQYLPDIASLAPLPIE